MKKKKETPADDARKQEEARRELIRQFNSNNFGELWVDPDKIPTEEDIAQAKKDFEDRVKAVQEKTYLIADANNAVRVATFIKTFLKTCFWVKEYWKGVLNLNGFIDDFLKDVEENGPKDLVMEYAPMQFTFALFDNYAGIGIDAADAFARISDEFIPLYDVLRDSVEWFNEENKACEKLRDRWTMFAQGYYLVILEHDTPVSPDKLSEDGTVVEDEPVADETPTENA